MNSLLLLLLLVAVLLSIAPLEAIGANNSYGCESSWTLYPNTNIYNGVEQPGVTSEGDCRAACYNDKDCQGIDFSPSNDQGHQCYLQYSTDPKYPAAGVNHWDYNRTAQCAGACSSWKKYSSTGYFGGIEQSTVTSEEDCKAACLRNSSCTGVDWNSQNPQGQQCYLQFGNGGSYYSDGVTHWQLNTTGGCQSSCGIWTPFSNTGIPNGIEQPSISSEEECKTACTGISSCTGIDWSPSNGQGHQCYVHFDYGNKNSWTGVTHWDFNRTGACQVDCLNAFTAYPNTGVAGGVEQPTVTSDAECKKACISNSDCVAVNWNPTNEPGHQCYLLSSTGPKNSWTGVYQYEFNRSACSVNCLDSFTAFPNKGVAGGTEQPSVTNETDCKRACIGNEGCVGVDWNPSNDPGHQCYLLSNSGPLNDWPGIYHYEFNRSACSVSNQDKKCWNVTKDTNAYNGMFVPGVTDVASCQNACLSQNSCTTIDWDRLQSSCYIFFNAQPTASAPGVDHYVYTC